MTAVEDLSSGDEKRREAGPLAALAQDLLTLVKHPVYVLAVLGSTIYVGENLTLSSSPATFE